MKGNKFRTNMVTNGCSKYLLLSTEIREYLKLEENDNLIVMLDEGKHGVFISVWKDDKKEA